MGQSWALAGTARERENGGIEGEDGGRVIGRYNQVNLGGMEEGGGRER